MTTLERLFDRENGWFTRSGPEHDVVISSRVRLSRNIEDVPFPGTMSLEQQMEFREILDPVLESCFPGDLWTVTDLDTLTGRQYCRLRERNVLASHQAQSRPLLHISRNDEQLGVHVNAHDHLAIVGLRSGFRPTEVFADVKEVESLLSRFLRFAVNMEFGYLSRDLDNCGTGLRASVLVHLAGLGGLNILGGVLEGLLGDRFTLKGFPASNGATLGHMYQISNSRAFGAQEEELLSQLEEVVGELLPLERAARNELLGRHSADGPNGSVVKEIEESWKTLMTAGELGSEEALIHLLRIRVGVSLGHIHSVDLSTITILLFLVQKCHILETDTKISDGDNANGYRADLVRQILGRKLMQRG